MVSRQAAPTLFAALLLAAASLAVFAPTAWNCFISLDDNRYIAENPQVRQGLTLRTTIWALTSTEHSNWYPLRRLTHLLDVSLFGMWAGGHHLVSAAWHAAAAALLFLALRLMTGAACRSFVVAALFGVHPLQVESVAWAAERSNVLAGFFFSLTLLLWVRYVRRPGAGRYTAALAAYALGLASKPTLVTLPFLLLLLDAWPLGRMGPPGAPRWRAWWPGLRRSLLEQSPPLALAAAAGAVAIAAHHQTGSLPTLASLPLSARLGNAVLSYASYLGQLFWPSGLAVFYPHPGKDIALARAWGSAALLVGATAFLIALGRRRPWLATGWLWYVGTLVPMSGIVQFGIHARADRFVYLPSIGIFLALVWLAAEESPRPLRRPAVLGPLAGAVLVALAATTVVQVHHWKDNLALYSHAIAVTSGNWLAENNLAEPLRHAGRHEESVAHIREALRIAPWFADAHNNLGIALYREGRLDEARARFLEAVRLKPDYEEALNNLAAVLADQGRTDEARKAFLEALRLRPNYALGHFNFGLFLERQGNRGEAADAYRRALEIDPYLQKARTRLEAIRGFGVILPPP